MSGGFNISCGGGEGVKERVTPADEAVCPESRAAISPQGAGDEDLLPATGGQSVLLAQGRRPGAGSQMSG